MKSIGIGASKDWKHKEGMVIDGQKSEMGMSRVEGSRGPRTGCLEEEDEGEKAGDPQKARSCRRRMRTAAVIGGERALENTAWKSSPRTLDLHTIFLSKYTLKLQTACHLLFVAPLCRR